MSAVTIPKDFSAKLAALVTKALKKDEEADIEEVISAYVAKLKPVKAARKPKKDKDPNAPKRGSSGYIFFGKKRRPELKEENPGISFGDLTKLIAEEWNALSDKKKKPFLDMAAKDKLRYEKEKKAYESGSADASGASDSEEKPKSRGKAKSKKPVESEDESEEKPAPKKASKSKAKAKKADDEESDEEFNSKESEEEVPATVEEEGDVDYSKMTLAELKKLCKEREVDVEGLKTKAEFVEALEG